MNILFLVIASISAISWVCLGVLFLGTMRKKHIFRGTAFSGEGIIYPSLSIVIAACNEEESIEQAVTQLITQDYHDFEVIVVNDRSTDRTGVILAELDIKYPQLKVITITNLPPNWLGKNHAIYQGVKHAKGEWLLFTDADVMFSPDSLKKTISYSLENNLDHLTIGPDIPHKGYIYGGFIAFLTLVITFLFIGSKSAGLGAFNLVKKSTYNAIGGHEALAMQPVDDFSLGKRWQDKGDYQPQEHPARLACLLEQGITTIVGGNCGFSPAPLAENSKFMGFVQRDFEFCSGRPLDISWTSMGSFFGFLETSGLSLNLAQLIGHGTLRKSLWGTDYSLPKVKMRQMSKIIEEYFSEGAYGLSLGLGYEPGMYVAMKELEEIALLVKRHDRLLTVHIKALARATTAYKSSFLLKPHNIRALEEMS